MADQLTQAGESAPLLFSVDGPVRQFFFPNVMDAIQAAAYAAELRFSFRLDFYQARGSEEEEGETIDEARLTVYDCLLSECTPFYPLSKGPDHGGTPT